MRPRLLPLALGLLPLAGCAGDSVKPPPPAVGFVPTPGSPSVQGRAVAVIKKAKGKVKPDSADPDQPVLTVDLHNVPVTGEILEAVTALPHLQELNLYNTGVTDEQLTRLAGLTELRTLDLCSTRVTDAGLASLRACRPCGRSTSMTRPSPTPAWAGSRSCRTWRTWT